jgi:hypothetical protein
MDATVVQTELPSCKLAEPEKSFKAHHSIAAVDYTSHIHTLHLWLIHYPEPTPSTVFPWPASAATFASIFLRAARIISSLLFCNNACRSPLFELQACCCFPVLSDTASGDSCRLASSANFAFRLYRVMRSGCNGFVEVVVEDADACDEAWTGRGGWKDCGGYSITVC